MGFVFGLVENGRTKYNDRNVLNSRKGYEPYEFVRGEGENRYSEDMTEHYIQIRGAKEHNLKSIDVAIPRDQLVVITGLSGSGKSSLAFDTIYAEGQRKYVESLSAYARQFLEQMQKPDIESIEGLPPTIAIDQRGGGHNPRSTVATTTEIYDYLRLLFARVGKPHCCICGKPIQTQHAGQITDALLGEPEGTRVQICAPLIRGQKGEHSDVLKRIQREGFIRARVDGQLYDVKDIPALDRKRAHSIEAVVDRLVLKPAIRPRLADSVEIALKLGEGLLLVLKEGKAGAWEEVYYSENYVCLDHPEVSMPELTPRCFSFNSPYGACRSCDGLGTILEFDPDLIVPDSNVSLTEGAIDAWRKGGKRMNIFYNRLIRRFCREYDISPDTPFKNIPASVRKILLYGSGDGEDGVGFEGVIPNLNRRFQNTDSEFVKARLHGYLSEHPCRDCGGARLRPESLAVLIHGRNIWDVTRMSIAEAHAFFKNIELSPQDQEIARLILKEVRHRLEFMLNVGLDYLTLNRMSGTLSGGEAQRIRLATQVGSALVGVCYVLDEPSIGLHHRDNQRLIRTMRHLTDLGNTVVVVEHDEDTIRAADHVIDMGPGAGVHGGEIVAQGKMADILAEPRSLTGLYFSGQRQIPLPEKRRKVNLSYCLQVSGVQQNNLKDIDVKFPLGVLVCVTGVSGSGKSSLVNQVLLPAVWRKLYNGREKQGKFQKLLGTSRIDKVIQIDQSPIGRTPRSNPATYTGVFDLIRQLFSKTREAKIRGYTPGRFSFNVKGGRCEHCQGQGTRKIEMHFLPDVYVVCDQCKGTRYNRETLEIKYRGKNIADVLDMHIEESLSFFENFPKIKQMVRTLYDVGLGYMKLGQASTTLSGGEAQRVKLATELDKASTGHTLYVLDEPTTGLHIADIHNLLTVLNQLVEMGNTVIVIEHNLDVIKMADYIIDLGPEGGAGGGQVVAAGSPEEISRMTQSFTGQFLKEKLRS
ncbi:MAG: UvrABC system protein A [Planctomycetes bacterium ADurb.Bin412]|nr:MAG: UvrABC system protein A [Planctomycetes bacterium ADurb.Bin412]